ncbi:molybdopterin-dependent oxidoreductase (plasmid) [Vibrio pelagius]|uniref:Molybdopterin-dependent oxidoreductase n=1 Tax=Vibrio pelagius TaxID=28169 RepID=A0ABY5GA83_VIBPE|nr:DMSO/selenate family reductase complex A subunit [Vibrio pelagius]UTT87114.1 molybdopterin-dependent oxidoreductase [Vibrio pelagius]
MSRSLFSESRRKFIKSSGLAAASVPFISGQVFASGSNLKIRNITDGEERVVQTCSTFDCGGKCDIRAHIKNGALTQITTRPDEDIDEYMPMMRGCVRGRGYRKFVNNPERLKYPMKRVGKRGEGKFERISWEEATSYIAKEIQRLTNEHGPECRFVTNNTAVTGGAFSGDKMLKRLFNTTGGYLSYYHSVSMGNTLAATPYTYGTAVSGNSMDTLLDSKLVILWGHNPTETIFGHSNHYYQQMKRNGTKFIVVDPRYSDTVSSYADQWIPLLPTSDNALMDAMMYVIYTENLHDADFIAKNTIGFDEDSMPEGVPSGESLVSYLTGVKDGVQKTPEWAEKITKVPAQTIREFAIEYATTKPAALIQGWAPQRHNCGERSARGSTLLATITGNVGVSGGWAGGAGFAGGRKFAVYVDQKENPVKESISIMNWVDAVDAPEKVTPEVGLTGAEQLKSPIKMIFSLAGNYLANQNPNINRAAKILEDENKVELIVVSDLYMSPSAQYADILLPETAFTERWNIGETWGTGSYLVLSEKLVEPDFERRSDYDWLCDVAKKLGVYQEFSEGRTEKQWIEWIWEETRKLHASDNLPSFEQFQQTRRFAFKDSTYVAFEQNVKNIEQYPLDTPSGKIEIFSKRLYDMNHPEIPALSSYVPAHEGFEDPLAKRFPLQLITWKPKNRANSTQFKNPWLQEVAKQELWMNPIDAEKRGVKDGELIKAYNDRGVVNIPVKVTPRIMPSVVALANGGWRQLNSQGVDVGGCANTLSSENITPLAKGNSHNTMLVEVEKA